MNVDNTQAETLGAEQGAAQSVAASFDVSGGFLQFLDAQKISIAFTSYQTGRLYMVGYEGPKTLSLHQAQYAMAMGVASDGQRIYLGTRNEIVRLENVLSTGQVANEKHDKLFVPRNFQTTGHVDIHEIAVRQGGKNSGKIVFVNTKYSCLAEPSLTHSFKPIWKPDFISKLTPEDRCHLNGLAMKDGQPKYVTAVCRSDVVDGWRDRRHNGGVIIDVDTQEIVAQGLSMPHSPRWHDSKLWVLNSGSGELGYIDMDAKAFQPVAFCPGFLRGLSFHGGYAFVTLSKPRYKRFEGLALDGKMTEKDADAWCGIQVISLATGHIAQWIRISGEVKELFDVCVMPGVVNPLTLTPNSQEISEFITFEALKA